MRMTELIGDALSVYRLTRLVTADVITEKVRNKILDRYPPSRDSWSYALTCPHCASIWVAVGVTALRVAVPRAWNPISYALASAAVTSLVAEAIDASS